MQKKIIEKVDFGVLGKLAIIITIILGVMAFTKFLWGGIKMFSPFLTKIDSFWLLAAVWFFTLFLLLLYERSYTKRTKQYDKLAEHVELPKAVDKAITVEKNPDWGILHPYKDIVQNIKGVPYLQFYMRVINRTYYYFEPEELVIGCLFDNHKLRDEWNSKVKTKETNIELDFLREGEDGTIRVRFPIKGRCANLRKWTLDGTVTYTLKGLVIEANKQYTRPEICIHIEYVLPEEQIMKLKEEVEKAIGDER